MSLLIDLRKLCDLTTKECVIEFHVRALAPLTCKPFAEACCRLLLLPASPLSLSGRVDRLQGRWLRRGSRHTNRHGGVFARAGI